MEKMTEDVFDALHFKILPKDCEKHCAVRIIDFAGAHNDYGCIYCGMKHTNREVFEKPGLEGYK